MYQPPCPFWYGYRHCRLVTIRACEVFESAPTRMFQVWTKDQTTQFKNWPLRRQKRFFSIRVSSILFFSTHQHHELLRIHLLKEKENTSNHQPWTLGTNWDWITFDLRRSSMKFGDHQMKLPSPLHLHHYHEWTIVPDFRSFLCVSVVPSMVAKQCTFSTFRDKYRAWILEGALYTLYCCYSYERTFYEEAWLSDQGWSFDRALEVTPVILVGVNSGTPTRVYFASSPKLLMDMDSSRRYHRSL